MPTLLHRAARWYAQHGIPVFPCAPHAKNPLTEHGFLDASADIKQIDEWWTRWPRANVAIPMGKASGLIAIDIDPRNGGRESWDSLVLQHGALPDTARQVTGRGDGGFHAFFRAPSVRLPETLGPGVDVQGEGGYVMAAPSIHPASGKPYIWDGIVGKEALLTPAECPRWMVELQRAARNGDVPEVIPSKIPKGRQHKMLVSMAGSMRKRGAEFPEIFAALVAMNPRLEEPAPEENLRKIAKSVCKYAPDKLLLEEEPATARSAAAEPPEAVPEPPPSEDKDVSREKAARSAPPEPMDREDVSPGPQAAPPPLDQLNRDAMFRAVGIVWTAIRKRGKRIEATTASGRIVFWDNAGDLLNFSKSEAVVADAMGVVLPKPAKGQLSWRRAAALILQIAEEDRTDIGDPIRLDTEEAIQTVHKAADHPCPAEDEQVFELIQELRAYRRDPHATDPPPCVFTHGGSVYVHRPTLRAWLSTPAGHNRLYPVAEMHAGLLAAEFVRVKDFRVQVNKKRLRIDLWKGPLSVLGGDETEIVTDEAK